MNIFIIYSLSCHDKMTKEYIVKNDGNQTVLFPINFYFTMEVNGFWDCLVVVHPKMKLFTHPHFVTTRQKKIFKKCW